MQRGENAQKWSKNANQSQFAEKSLTNKQTNMAKTYFKKENIFPQAIFVQGSGEACAI